MTGICIACATVRRFEIIIRNLSTHPAHRVYELRPFLFVGTVCPPIALHGRAVRELRNTRCDSNCGGTLPFFFFARSRVVRENRNRYRRPFLVVQSCHKRCEYAQACSPKRPDHMPRWSIYVFIYFFNSLFRVFECR